METERLRLRLVSTLGVCGVKMTKHLHDAAKGELYLLSFFIASGSWRVMPPANALSMCVSVCVCVFVARASASAWC